LSVRIAPSILAADFLELGKAVSSVEAGGADLIHVDVMDGHFVPNLTMGTPVVVSLKRGAKLPLDVHLMISEPHRYLEMFANAGAAVLNVHAEVCADLRATVAAIHQLGVKAGVAVNPETPFEIVRSVAASIDHLLVMTVHPGFTGQKFLARGLERIAEARALLDATGSKAEIVIDGGVDLSNAPAIVDAGGTVLVAGACVFHTPDPGAAVGALRRAAERTPA
jgi:ribulose-phosphate 3-epimerase